MNERELFALSNVLSYLWADEQKFANANNGTSHMFNDLRVLSQVKEREMCNAEPPQEMITPATGERLKRLKEMASRAEILPKILEEEISGVRDGDGFWHGSDPLQGTVSDLWRSYQNLEALELCPRCGAHEQATHHSACQSRDGTPTSLADEQVREVLDSETPLNTEILF
jgi:hypothetical protein